MPTLKEFKEVAETGKGWISLLGDLWGVFTSVFSFAFWGGLILWAANTFFPQLGIGKWLNENLGPLIDQGLAAFAGTAPEMAESVAGLLETYLGGWGKGIADRIRNALREALKNMDNATFEKTIAGHTGIPEIAQELTKSRQAFKTFLETSKLQPGDLTSKAGILALLNADGNNNRNSNLVDSGRKVVDAMLTGYERAMAPGGTIAKRPAGQQPSEQQVKLQQALHEILQDSRAFERLMNNPQNQALIYRAVPMAAAAAGIHVTNPGGFAQSLGQALKDLSYEERRQVFVALADPQRVGDALGRIYFDSRIPSAALAGLAQSIQPAPSADESLRATIQRLQNDTRNLEPFTAQREVMIKVGREAAIKLQDPDPVIRINALAEAATRKENPITGAQIAALLGTQSAASDRDSAMTGLLRDPHHADNVVRFIKAVGKEEVAKLAATLTTVTGEGNRASPPLLNTFRNSDHTTRLIGVHAALGTEKFNSLTNLVAKDPLPVKEVIALVGEMNHTQLKTVTTFVETLPGGGDIAKQLTSLASLTPAQKTHLTSLLQTLPAPAIKQLLTTLGDTGSQVNFERVLTMMMDDTLRTQFSSTQAKAALANLITVSVEPSAEMQKVTEFLTGGGGENLTSLLALIDTIDKNTGGAPGSEDERRADQNNAKAISFLKDLATGTKRAPDTATIAAISTLMGKKENVDAVRVFLETIDTTTLSEAHQEFLKVLKANWYVDSNKNGKMDAAGIGLGAYVSSWLYKPDSGLAAHLADPNAARIIVGQITNPSKENSGHLDKYPELEAIGKALAKLSNPKPVDSVVPPLETNIPGVSSDQTIYILPY